LAQLLSVKVFAISTTSIKA